MAKKGTIENNNKRARVVAGKAAKRNRLKEMAEDRDLPAEDRFAARLKLAEMPRNSSKTRLRNRCQLSGRPRGYYRRFKLSRVALRELGSRGQIPGLTKSSW